MKIDVEGSELQALEGMQNILENNRIVMMIEINKNKKEVTSFLSNLGISFVSELKDSKGEVDYLFSNSLSCHLPQN